MAAGLVKVVSHNVNGILNPIKRSKMLRKMKREKAGIVFLQETHLSEPDHAKPKKRGLNQIFSASYKFGPRRGVSVLIAEGLYFETQFEIKDKEGRYIMVGGRFEGIEVTFLNVYAPPGANWSFFGTIFDLMLTKARGLTICGGDLNVRLNPKLDSSGGSSPQSSSLRRKINSVLQDSGIVDVWRKLHPSIIDFTYFSSPHSTYSRIDYFLMVYKDVHMVISCGIGLMDISDHCPVQMKIELHFKRRILLWRLNASILNGKMKDEIKEEIGKYLNENDNGEVSPPFLWDACKAVLRGKIIAKTAALKKEKNKELINLEVK